MRSLNPKPHWFLLLVVFLLAACGGDDGEQAVRAANGNSTSNTEDRPSNTLSFAGLPVRDDQVVLVARVNDTDITLPEFERALIRSTHESSATDPLALAASVLDILIEQTLIEQGAAKMQIAISDEALDAELQANIELAGGSESWTVWLSDNLYTESEYRQTLRGMLLTARLRDVIAGNLTGSVPQVHARHILVDNDPLARDTLSRLQAGEDFATLALELSRDVTSFEQGGDLGWFTREELLEPALAEVAFSLEPGQMAGPVATRLGYHIIQTLEFSEGPIDPNKLASMAQFQFEAWLQGQMETAVIERYLQ